jgi:hypothetical protein
MQRFIAQDPMDFAGGDTNLYGYVWEEPTGFLDGMGLNGAAAAAWAKREVGKGGYSWLDGNSEVGSGSNGYRKDYLGGALTYKCNKFVFDALTNGGDPRVGCRTATFPSPKIGGIPPSKYQIIQSCQMINPCK